LNNTQRVLLSVYLPLTILILLLDPTHPVYIVVQSIRYTTIISLFFAVTLINKKYNEQKIMAPAFFFMALGDFFLVFVSAIGSIQVDLSAFGICSFLIAYLFLIKAYRRKTLNKGKEILAAIPFLITFIFAAYILAPYIHGAVLFIAIGFSFVLCYMSWSAVCTLFQNYYSHKAAIMIAISGIMMYICDMGIAFSLFHPIYSTVYIPILKNIVWFAYILGWSLAAAVIAEDNLLLNN